MVVSAGTTSTTTEIVFDTDSKGLIKNNKMSTT